MRVRLTRLDPHAFYPQENPTPDDAVAHHWDELTSACSKIEMMGGQLEAELAVLMSKINKNPNPVSGLLPHNEGLENRLEWLGSERLREIAREEVGKSRS
jgi:hypothetical protein